MSKRKKPDICLENVGELFTDGEDYFTLLSCETEPRATIQRLYPDDSGKSDRIEKPLTQFLNLVLVKPVRPIAKPKKPRADKGTQHKTSQKKATRGGETEKLDINKDILSNNLFVHVPTGLDGDLDYVVKICGSEARTPIGLRAAVQQALTTWHGIIPPRLSNKERDTIQGILNV